MALRFALIGFGRWGQRYAETIASVAGASLSEIVTRDPARQRLAAARASVTPDWHDVLRSGRSDAVIIATPPSMHAEILRACIDARRPAIVEKPLCLDYERAAQLAARVEASGVPVLVDHTLLFNPAYERLKTEVASRGAIQFITAEGMNFGPFRHDPPTLWDWGPHPIACCLDLLDSRPDGVRSLGSGSPGGGGSDSDMAAVCLTFPSGATAWIHTGRASLVRRRSLAVFCENGALLFEDGVSSVLDAYDAAWGSRYGLPTAHEAAQPRRIVKTCERALTRLLQYFVAGIAGGDRRRFGLRLGVEVVGVLGRAQQ